jgi:hypothetical protein
MINDSELIMNREEDEIVDVVLANKIVEALVSKGLVSAQRSEVTIKKIAFGKMTAEDWKSCVELNRQENGENV